MRLKSTRPSLSSALNGIKATRSRETNNGLRAIILLLLLQSQTGQGFLFWAAASSSSSSFLLSTSTSDFRGQLQVELKREKLFERKIPPAKSFIYLRTIFVFSMSRYETRHRLKNNFGCCTHNLRSCCHGFENRYYLGVQTVFFLSLDCSF